MQPLFDRSSRRARRNPGDINYLRFPAFLSGLLLLVFFSAIAQRGEPAFRAASSKTLDPYLERWLLVSGVFFLVSALAYAVRGRRTDNSVSVSVSEPA